MLILAIIINFGVAAWLYPEVFTRVDLRLVQGHDTCGPMQYVFYLIGQFYQGGVQLFDRYDLMNTSFTQLSVGLYTPLNFLIAAGYIVLSPLVENPAQFFHHWYVLLYYGLGLLLRTFGIYILVFYMTKSRFTAIITSVLVNSFCALTLIHMGGMCVAPVFNFLPLLLFCLVYYWETRAFKAIVASVLVFVFAAIHSLYVGLGYFYQILHLFLFDMLVIWLIFQRGRKPLLAEKFQWKTTGKVVLAVALVLLPVVWWGQSLVSDFEVSGSGLGETQGRFNRVYNPAAMMKDPMRYFIASSEVWKHSYDFTTSAWYLNGAFVGITTLVLTAIGMVLGKHSYKFVFMTAAVFMAFLNVPSTKGGWMMWAHWIDTITNPFCFLVRSFHQSLLLWYLSLVIPVCLGVQACVAIVKNNPQSIYAGRTNFLKGALAAVLVACLYIPNPQIKTYALSVLSLFLIFFLVFDQQKFKVPVRLWLAGILFLVVGGIEFAALRTYITTKNLDMNWMYWDGLRIKPRVFSPMYTPVPMVLDYQNPKILPVRFYYRTDKQVVFPLLCEFQGLFGQFYRYIPLALRLERPDGMYVPRMKIFKNIDQDKQIQEYIQRDGRVMYMADAAIAPDQKNYERVLALGLDRRLVQAEGAHLDKLQNLSEVNLPQALPQGFKPYDYVFQADQARVHKKTEGTQYQWRLPKGFPQYLSTPAFTADVQLWQLNIGGQKLIPAQGALVHPLTFDVNNVRDGYLTVLMPGPLPTGQAVDLHVWTPAEIVDIWRNTQDEFGFTYNAARRGWWVMHMPYDPKWQLFIDGTKTPLSKINRYFIGAPLEAGEHQILLTYWPNNPLRPLILVSTLMACVLMFMVFRWTYLWSREK